MKWSFYASGFREKRGAQTGTKANARKARDLYQSSDCAVIYCEYDDDPEEYAKDVAAQWQEGDTIIVEGYSWGCGNWVRKFSWSLFKAQPEARIQHLTLVDPVVHTKLFSLRWFAITDWGKIKFPPNIRNAFVFYQRIDEPNASKLVFGSPLSAAYSQLEYKHTKIDNAPEVTNMTLAVAEKYLKK